MILLKPNLIFARNTEARKKHHAIVDTLTPWCIVTMDTECIHIIYLDFIVC